MAELLRIEYVEARRVLLDALEAMRAHIDALVLVGAQAVYLRSEGRLASYQAHTTDADVVLDPTKLGPIPPVGKAMESAGFVLTAEPGIWEARFDRPGFDDQIVVPVDLIVPEQFAARAGKRAARLPGEHGKSTARKSAGLEGAVVDNSPIEIAALEAGDVRRVMVNVAGVGALLVAKSYKLGERLAKPERLQAKDAGDVYRLFDATAPDEMAAILSALLDDERSARATDIALDYARQLFMTPAGAGVPLAVQALRGSLPEPTVIAVITGYMREVFDQLDR
jgi:hypothetical protein